MRLRRRERGQAMVESALTLPMMLFTMLGILQLTTAYHARILSEYAAFKAARAGSVYRAECEFMLKSALVALVPSIMEPSNAIKGESVQLRKGGLKQTFINTASYAEKNTTNHGTPIAWIEYSLENTGKDFDKLLESNEEPMRLRVHLAYFYEMRIPFANWIMARFWVASQLGGKWGQSDGSDSTIMVKKESAVSANKTVELADQVRIALNAHDYVIPISASWTMRMMSDPTEKALNNSGEPWFCKDPKK